MQIISIEKLIDYIENNQMEIDDILDRDEKDARKHGEWIVEGEYDITCSECECDAPMYLVNWERKHCKTKFCPNCGARMTNSEDDDDE